VVAEHFEAGEGSHRRLLQRSHRKGKETGSAIAGRGEGLALKADDMEGLKDKLESEMKKMPDFQK